MDENEKTLLLDRTYECPICDHKIKAKSVKTSVAKFVETKADLRPIYSNINVTKYDTVCCNYCGYAALTKDFMNTTQVQRKLLREKIQATKLLAIRALWLPVLVMLLRQQLQPMHTT